MGRIAALTIGYNARVVGGKPAPWLFLPHNKSRTQFQAMSIQTRNLVTAAIRQIRGKSWTRMCCEQRPEPWHAESGKD